MSSFSRWRSGRVFDLWFNAANNAIHGILQAAKTQRHLNAHVDQ